MVGVVRARRRPAAGEYFDGDTTFVFALNRATGRVRRVSDEVMAVPDDIPPIGLDWQAIR
jgi:hypothetical protein